MLVVVVFYWLLLCGLPYIIPTCCASDLGTSIQALSWLNVASRIGAFLLAENSSLVNSGCHYKLIFPSICVGGETGVTNGGLVSATGTVGLYPTGLQLHSTAKRTELLTVQIQASIQANTGLFALSLAYGSTADSYGVIWEYREKPRLY
ncbi:hypothetical protein C8J56DRAFT_905792 [Mycena floridula]|nr:hypothetical protein C8J56DRAFT_905792 [Mycena floridula]